MDFTTEGAQHDCRRDCNAPHGTCEGTSLIDREIGVSFGLKRNIVEHFAANRAGADVGGSPLRNGGLDIAAVAGEAVFAAVAEIADVIDVAAGRNHLHQRTVHSGQSHFAAKRVDLDVAVFLCWRDSPRRSWF